MTEYRITYVIERKLDDRDFIEIGFGSSGGAMSISSAAYDVQSQIDNNQWETSDGMPDPEGVE